MKPKYLYHINDPYLMELQNGGYYETTMPKEKVGKIGVSYPRKKKFLLEELQSKGYKTKI